VPAPRTLAQAREQARGCRNCPLWRNATQTVFGAGPARARVMLVGEQPGNEEDLAGEPFVGPAGRLLDRALESAGIARKDAYVTNVVKHFKFTPSGKRRLHQRPNAREIDACVPWLETELVIVDPEVLIALGATAAQALFGKKFRVSQQRGARVTSALAPHALATVHPSSILRAPTSEQRAQDLQRFVDDLRVAARWLKPR
jgi:DNA polymerase